MASVSHESRRTADGPVTWRSDFPGTWQGIALQTVPHAVGTGLRTHAAHHSLVFGDGFSISNGELLRLTEQFAGYLSGRVEPGDRVALAIGNRTEFVIAYLAAVANRAVVVSLSPEIGSHEAEFIVGDSHCVVAITDDTSFATFEALRTTGSGSLRDVYRVEGQEPYGFGHLVDGVSALSLVDVHSKVEDLVDIGYTSGTTGLPKALGGSHRETLRYMDTHLRNRIAGDDHRILCPLQFHYGDPLTMLFSAIAGGTSVIVVRKFSASRFWDVARENRATEILSIGSIPDMLLSRPESPSDRDHSIRRAIALAIPPQRHAELERRFGFPWVEVYGSSESGPAIAMPYEYAEEFVGTGALGIPYPDINARLVDPDGQVVAGPGIGELELSGEIVFEGYIGNPEATAEVMHDGWLRSGDILERDERGVFYFRGRRKELIRRSGINIAPAEIETVLRLHPDVLDAAVVPVDDDMMGEEIKAYVELADGVPFDPAALADFCADRLHRNKVPRYIEERSDPFPRTPSQRIPKNELKVDGIHAVDRAWDRNAHEGARR